MIRERVSFEFVSFFVLFLSEEKKTIYSRFDYRYIFTTINANYTSIHHAMLKILYTSSTTNFTSISNKRREGICFSEGTRGIAREDSALGL